MARPSAASLVATVKAHALTNYEVSPVSWDYVIECWSDAEIEAAIAGAQTIKSAIRKIAVRLPERVRPLHRLEF